MHCVQLAGLKAWLLYHMIRESQRARGGAARWERCRIWAMLLALRSCRRSTAWPPRSLATTPRSQRRSGGLRCCLTSSHALCEA